MQQMSIFLAGNRPKKKQQQNLPEQTEKNPTESLNRSAINFKHKLKVVYAFGALYCGLCCFYFLSLNLET